MLAELRMELETNNEDFSYYQSSNMQGVLMQQIDTLYAEKLHIEGLNPYSQHLLFGEKKYWIIKTLNQEAYKNIICPLLDDSFQNFLIEKKNIKIKIIKKEVSIKHKSELVHKFYQDGCDRYLNIEFMTPTAFKSNGSYVFMPELKLIYQSLMNKYTASCSDMDLFDTDMLDELVRNSTITKYRLHSTSFPLEGTRIPAFRGNIRIRIYGAETMARYIRFLVEFGEYSGVGIKAAMGMGAIRINDARRIDYGR